MLSPSKVHFLKKLFRGIILLKGKTAIDFHRTCIEVLSRGKQPWNTSKTHHTLFSCLHWKVSFQKTQSKFSVSQWSLPLGLCAGTLQPFYQLRNAPHRTFICWCLFAARFQLLPASPCNGLAVSNLRKAALEEQTPAPRPGVFLSLILLLSLKKCFDLLLLHRLSRHALVTREPWNSRPLCLLVLGVRFGGLGFSIQMSLLDLNRSEL